MKKDIIALILSLDTVRMIELLPRAHIWGITQDLGVSHVEEDLNLKEDSSLEMEISHRRDKRVIYLRKWKR